MFDRLRKWIRHISGIDDPPDKIARGLALGIFVGFVPIMGIQMAAVLPFALLFRGNKAAAMAGVWISNPLTVIPIYFVDYIVGLQFLPYRHLTWNDFSSQLTTTTMTKFLALGEMLVVPLFLGGAVVGVICGIPTYFVTKALVERSRRRLARRRERKEAQKRQQAEQGSSHQHATPAVEPVEPPGGQADA